MSELDSSPETGGTHSLYDRVGGDAVIKDMVIEFYVKVFADPELSPFFKDTAVDRLHGMQREFFSAALDGPIGYSGRPLHSVHAGRGIRPEHMKRFVGHMLDTLERFDLTEEDRRDVIGRINTYADEIIGGYGSGG